MRASDRAYRALLAEIQTGTLAAGAVLSETEQAGRLGVSRTPLREAIARLTADGLVQQQSPRVTIVTPIDSADIVALFDLRRALEETAARLAARRDDRTAFVALADEFDSASVEGESAREAYYALIARFDAALDAAAENDYLAAALRTVRTHLVRVRRLARHKPGRLAASVGEHRLIAQAIAAGDPDLAAHATHVHLHNAVSSILSSLDEVPSARTPGPRSRAEGPRSPGPGAFIEGAA
ncbi:MAG: GntR family transcriptional regulator [Microbacterium sp.]|uniref:GntR family transcriptional regulator n=1 Tax=Microbacterium sp. TaxID=51671 RepID=UPI002609B6E8|nr:GntR family transcriptional regulator [Microbacterium sp.]MCX6502586.1 GntR family transcriptional regulator [Microbacterium sp.]